MTTAVTLIDSALGRLLQYPELHPYFYDGLDIDRSSLGYSAMTPRVEVFAELLGDAFENALYTTLRVNVTSANHADVADAVIFHLSRSPVMRRLVRDRPSVWPEIAAIAQGMSQPHSGEKELSSIVQEWVREDLGPTALPSTIETSHDSIPPQTSQRQTESEPDRD